MKKIIIFITLLSLITLLSSCSKVVIDTIDNPEIELFSILYENEEYSVYKRNEMEDGIAFYEIGYSLGEDNHCTFGEIHKYMYRVLYEEKYYNIFEAYKLDIYTVKDLVLMGIIGDCIDK